MEEGPGKESRGRDSGGMEKQDEITSIHLIGRRRTVSGLDVDEEQKTSSMKRITPSAFDTARGSYGDLEKDVIQMENMPCIEKTKNLKRRVIARCRTANRLCGTNDVGERQVLGQRNNGKQ